MKLRGFHLRGHSVLGDMSLDFRSVGGVVSSLVGLVGGNGSGKSLVSDMISYGWGGSVLNKRLPVALNADFCRLDFEDSGEILSIHIRGDQVDASTKLAVLFDNSLNRNMVLKYDSQRVSNLPLWTKMAGNQSLGVRAIWPIISDLHEKNVSDSIIVIDDFDIGLDRVSQYGLFKHLRNHYRSKRNQLILLSHEKISKADGVWLDLPVRVDSLESAMLGFSLNSVKK